MKVGDEDLTPMIVSIEGEPEFKVWRKTVIASYRVVSGTVTTYVDEFGKEVDLPEVYEMRGVTE